MKSLIKLLRINRIQNTLKKSIKIKLITVFSFIYVFLILIFIYFFNYYLYENITEQMELRSLALAENIKVTNLNYLQNYHFQAIEQNIDDLCRGEDIAFIVIFDKEGDIAARAGRLIDIFLRNDKTYLNQLKMLKTEDIKYQTLRWKPDEMEYELLEVALPIYIGDKNVKWGLVLLGIDLGSVNSKIYNAQFLVFSIGIGLIVIGLVAVSVFSDRIVKPIKEMIRVATLVAKGDLSQRIKSKKRDELGSLASAFNVMTEQLQGQVGDLLTINELSRGLSSILKKDQIADYLFINGRRMFHFESIAIGVLDSATRDSLAISYRSINDNIDKEITRGVWSELLKDLVKYKKTLFYSGIPDSTDVARFLKTLVGKKYESMLAIPMIYGGRSLGFIMLLSQDEILYQPSEIHYITIIANHAAVTIINSRAYEIISELNIDLEKRISDRTLELENRNLDLEKALQELNEAQEQLVQSTKMAALGELVAGVAHEINSPLGSINANIDLYIRIFDRIAKILRLAKKDPSAYDKINRLIHELKPLNAVNQEACNRIIKIVSALKNFARLDEAEWKPANINEGIESTLALIEHETKTRIDIEKKLRKIPDIMCYPDQLNQVFMNVLINAAQAIHDKGKITIETSFKDNNIKVMITDTGCGIAPENLKKIFDPGFTTKGVGVGTGLGLSISYKIIEKHRGELKVKSEEGKGTRFDIILPLK